MIDAPIILAGSRTVCGPWWTQPEAYTDIHRLYLIRSGSGEVTVDGRPWRLSGRMIFLIPGYREFAHRCRRELILDWLHFRMPSLEFDAALSELDGAVAWGEAMWARWRSSFAQIAAYEARPTYEAELRIAAMVIELLAECLGPYLDQPGQQPVKGWRQRLRPAVRFMDAAYGDQPSLARVARVVHLSPPHFHRRFREAFGITPHAYMERLRMRKAVSILRSGEANVSETARRLGFANASYFSRAFRRYHGCTPTEAARRPFAAVP